VVSSTRAATRTQRPYRSTPKFTVVDQGEYMVIYPQAPGPRVLPPRGRSPGPRVLPPRGRSPALHLVSSVPSWPRRPLSPADPTSPSTYGAGACRGHVGPLAASTGLGTERVTASAVMGRTWSSSTVSARQRQCQEEQRWPPVWLGGRRRHRDRDQAADSRMLRAQRACRDCGERVTRTRVRDLRNERRPRRHAPAALGRNILSDFGIGVFARNDQRLLSVTARSGMRVPRAGRCGRPSVPHPICRTLCHRLAARP
jgi:hypothetical protein